jgi:hypothetical protein
MNSPASTVAVDGTQDKQLVATSKNGTYYGLAVRETSSSASAVLRIREGGATGRILETISLAASESRSEFYVAGLAFASGLYEDWVSGAYEGSVRYEAA